MDVISDVVDSKLKTSAMDIDAVPLAPVAPFATTTTAASSSAGGPLVADAKLQALTSALSGNVATAVSTGQGARAKPSRQKWSQKPRKPWTNGQQWCTKYPLREALNTWASGYKEMRYCSLTSTRCRLVLYVTQ